MAFAAHDLTCIRGERLLFAGLSFAVSPGQMLVLRGPNGSGKTSLLRLCAGLLPAAQGHLAWQGQRVEDALDLARHLAWLGHAEALKPALTVHENLSFWARFAGRAGAVDAALAALDLVALADLPARFLSAGQRRRVALARLVAANRTLWLLDEPTNALDSAAVTLFAAQLRAHLAAGGMAIAATHLDFGFADMPVLELGR